MDSRGTAYLQVVSYDWDKAKKRGVTRFVRQIGPARRFKTETAWIRESGILPDVRLETFLQRRRKWSGRRLSMPTLRRIESGVAIARHASDGLSSEDRFLDEIEAIVRAMRGRVTRGTVVTAAFAMNLPPPRAEFTFADQVGVALRRLTNDGRIERHGLGGRRNPFNYTPSSS